MEDAPEASNSSSRLQMRKNGPHDNTKDNQEGVPLSAKGRKARGGFSDPSSCQEFASTSVGEDMDLYSHRGVQEDCSRSSESETASSKAGNVESESPLNAIYTIHWHGFFNILKKGPPKPKSFLPTKNVRKLTRRKSKRYRDNFIPVPPPPLDEELCCFKSSWRNFSLSELQYATDNFSTENLIGEGGYAEVYKGKLEDGKYVAIKRLTRGSPEEMTADFLSELGIIVHVDHPNVATLIGYGVEGGMHLVLQLSPHGSLSSILYGPRERLDWGVRFKVALGTASGLLYLHEECQRRIIHKDIKASNILLSEDFEPQISDFGLSKWLPDQWTHHTVTQFEGTFGYLPPEFFMHGIVDEKTDVYAYGVLLLELITGRKALDNTQQSLVMWAKPYLNEKCFKELVDPFLSDAFDMEQMKCAVFTASLCVHQSSLQRPQMSQVVSILKGTEDSLELMKLHQNSKLQRTYSEELLDADEYNSTKYLSDMDRHMQMVMSLGDD